MFAILLKKINGILNLLIFVYRFKVRTLTYLQTYVGSMPAVGMPRNPGPPTISLAPPNISKCPESGFLEHLTMNWLHLMMNLSMR